MTCSEINLKVFKRNQLLHLSTDIRHFNFFTIIHLASLLSATAEKDPQKAWDLNMGGLMNALEVARELELQVFNPSSIAAFGQSTRPDDTAQHTLLRQNTTYDVTRESGHL